MVRIRLAKFVTVGFLAVVPFAAMPPAAVADPNVAVLAFGLAGSQSVFESEAKGSAAVLAQTARSRQRRCPVQHQNR
jgi:hypothetical protein